jgi:hypothetical protein
MKSCGGCASRQEIPIDWRNHMSVRGGERFRSVFDLSDPIWWIFSRPGISQRKLGDSFMNCPSPDAECWVTSNKMRIPKG